MQCTQKYIHNRVQQLVCITYVCMHTFIGAHMTLARMLIFSLLLFEVFKIFLILVVYTAQKFTAMYSTFNLFLYPWKRHILYCLHLF